MKKKLDFSLRTRYAETDQMGYIHHSIYPQYFEVARIEFMKTIGISYKKMEEEGIILPVFTMNIKYLIPLTFDELITIRTSVKYLKGVRLSFVYEIYNQNNQKSTEAEVVLIFAGSNGKPIKPPIHYVEKLNQLI